MVDELLTRDQVQKGITIARMKVGTPSYLPQTAGLTETESRLADIVDIGSAVQERAQKTRRLDGYLRFFQSFLRYINHDPARLSVRPQISPVSIEYINLENPYKSGIDKKV